LILAQAGRKNESAGSPETPQLSAISIKKPETLFAELSSHRLVVLVFPHLNGKPANCVAVFSPERDGLRGMAPGGHIA